MITDEQLKEFAENYILTQYAPPGLTGYLYEDTDDPYDDTSYHAYYSESPKPDEEALSSWEILDTEIQLVTVEERNDEAGEYEVVVEALVTIRDSDNEEEDEEEEKQEREITVYVGVDRNGELYVERAEE
ncbi:hypothetical protein I8752_31655 [Nostocaceae cyanobacterium CENA369]|uniref:Uncharacterized protein n=1 Tax=Dendronalium phyllosphericum CENA369 TaxID=1725256 RepID=A0A8J7LJE1_9NOST|nr:hypothetical protein [Dendronalium phyllosphericum]MBH8577444.1 hypothetical protein [Dendronalium phyllosphericum CENA369]